MDVYSVSKFSRYKMENENGGKKKPFFFSQPERNSEYGKEGHSKLSIFCK